MAVLPSGLVVPPLPYAAALVVSAVLVAAFLVALRPRFDQQMVAALTPWMAAGAVAHALYQVEPVVLIFPEVVEPLLAAPAVYLTTFVVMGGIWIFITFVGTADGGSGERVPLYMTIVGVLVLAGLLGYSAYMGVFSGATPYWPTMSLLAAVPAAAIIYFGMAYWATAVVARARVVGGIALFAHLLDGVTTAVGVDILGSGERSPLPRTIMDLASQLPTAQYIGSGWLFVLVKLAVVVAIVYVFADYLEDEPARGNLLFAVVIAFGLGPAINNLLLFSMQDLVRATTFVG